MIRSSTTGTFFVFPCILPLILSFYLSPHYYAFYLTHLFLFFCDFSYDLLSYKFCFFFFIFFFFCWTHIARRHLTHAVHVYRLLIHRYQIKKNTHSYVCMYVHVWSIELKPKNCCIPSTFSRGDCRRREGFATSDGKPRRYSLELIDRSISTGFHARVRRAENQRNCIPATVGSLPHHYDRPRSG